MESVEEEPSMLRREEDAKELFPAVFPAAELPLLRYGRFSQPGSLSFSKMKHSPNR
jgi:hypothetical protein